MRQFFLGVTVAAALLAGVGSIAQAKDNFTIADYKVDMELGRDVDKRSTLRTKITITADFPPQQNHGIAPIFVKTYHGHPTRFALESVTNEDGAPLKHQWKGDELRIGDKDSYVEGRKTYVITYTQRDVTRLYHDTGKNEFYWDAIGTDWRVPITTASVTLQLSPELTAAKQTALQCYQGKYGSGQPCSVHEQMGTFVASTHNLSRGAGVTVALGFAPDTFAPYQATLTEQLIAIWAKVQYVLAGVACGLLVLIGLAYHRSIGRKNRW